MTDSGASGAGRGGRPAVVLTLLHRAYCHLCDEMLAALRPLAAAHGASIEVIDIDGPGHAALEREWGERVPVLFRGRPAASNEVCHYRLDVSRVAAALAGDAAPGLASPTEIR